MKKLLLSIFSFLLLPFFLHGQADMRGTDFWATFGTNGIANFYDIGMQIRVVSDGEATSGVIYFTQIQDSVKFNVAAGQVYTLPLNSEQKSAVYNTTMGKNNLSVRIKTTKPVTAYVINHAMQTTDATNLIPVSAWGTDYYHVSYRVDIKLAPPPKPLPDAYAVIASQDQTKVYHNGTLRTTLNKGEVYYYTEVAEITGAHITTSKPVAYFAMDNGTYLPDGMTASGDVLFQQLTPVNTWGKKFMVPVSNMDKDRVRIMVSQNGTNLTITGGSIQSVPGSTTTLTNRQAGQWIELEVSLAGKGCYIEANKPVGVATYLTGGHYNGTTDNSSDPSQAWLPPVEQTVTSVLMAPFIPDGKTALKTHYALIVTPTATKTNTTVRTGTGTESALSGGIWYDNAASGMSFYTMPLTNKTASYSFTNRAGLMVMGYGIGDAESYYYLAGSAMRNLATAFYVNDIHYQDLASHVFCKQPTQFRAEITGDMSKKAGHLKWFIDNVEEVPVRDLLTWSKTLADGKTYMVRMEVLMDDDSIKKIEAPVTISLPELDSLTNVTLCAGETSELITFKGKYLDVGVCTWTGSNGVIGLATGGTGMIQPFTATNTTALPITDTITVTPKSSTGCVGKPKKFTITVNPLPTLQLPSPPTYCDGDTTVPISLTANMAGNVTWKVPANSGKDIGMTVYEGQDVIPPFVALNTRTTGASAAAVITLTPISDKGCTGQPKTLTITVDPAPVVNIPDNFYLCIGDVFDSLTFSGTAMSGTDWQVISGSGAAIGMPVESGSATVPAFTATNQDSAALSVTIAVTPKSAIGCAGTVKTFTITVYPSTPLYVNLGNDTTICWLDSLRLDATHPEADRYSWQDHSNGSTYTVRKEAGGQYFVTLSNRCYHASDTLNVSYLNALKQVNLGKEILFCEEDMIYRVLNVTTVGATSYLWQDDSDSPTYTITQTGIYSVTVSNVCMSVSDEVEVKVKDCRVLELWIPNAFTPDEDGINDIFKPEINNPDYLKEYEMAIYNRWGGLVFITHEYLTGWNGKSNNKNCSGGVYTAIIKYKDNENREFVKVGTVVLVR